MRRGFLRFAESAAAFRGVFANPDLRRLELAAAGSIIGQYAFTLALAVYAYEAGGATAVGAVAVIRTVPAALAAPFVSVVADRYARRRVMLGADLIRAALIGVAALLVTADVTYWAVFCIAGLVRITSMAFRPAEAAILPELARTPEQLTAANVTASTIDSVGIFIGPAMAGLLFAATDAAGVFVLTSLAYVWSAFLVARITRDAPPDRSERGSFWHETTAGFSAIAAEPRLRLIVGLYSAQTVVAGAQAVLIVVSALDLLGVGESGLGFLNSAAGIGGLVGAAVAVALAARKRVAADFGIGVALFGIPLLLIGLAPSAPVALVALVLLGIGNTLTDVNAMTLLQRNAADAVLARVFGVLHSALVGTMGLGALLAPILIETIGIRAALIVTGSTLPVVAGLTWHALRAVDRGGEVPEADVALLRGVPIFGPLPAATVEHLARRLVPRTVVAGEVVFHEGDHGDRFYVVRSGSVDVLLPSGPKVEGAGAWFGELALLRDAPRSATVRAREDSELVALERDDFLPAVTGHARSHAAATEVVGARLGYAPTA